MNKIFNYQKYLFVLLLTLLTSTTVFAKIKVMGLNATQESPSAKTVSKWDWQLNPHDIFTLAVVYGSTNRERIIVHVNPNQQTLSLSCNGVIYKVRAENRLSSNDVVCEFVMSNPPLFYIDTSDIYHSEQSIPGMSSGTVIEEFIK